MAPSDDINHIRYMQMTTWDQLKIMIEPYKKFVAALIGWLGVVAAEKEWIIAPMLQGENLTITIAAVTAGMVYLVKNQ